MKKILACILAAFTFNILGARAQNVELSSKSRISLLTCSAGEELYTQFGHSAIRVYDDSLNIDLVFNYGTFDFDTPNFYLKFVNGELDYMLSISEFQRFKRAYQQENRSVTEHVFNLSQSEKNDLWQRLVTNYQPQNRYYRYDFFFDNCATRIRDLLFEVKKIEQKQFDIPTNSTFRQYLHSCIGTTSWASQGIDLILGAKTDKEATVYQRAFLPVYLDSLLIDAKITDKSSILINVCDKQTSIHEEYTCIITNVGVLIIGILVTLFEVRKSKHCKLFDIILFTTVSLIAIILFYGWMFTSHSVLTNNTNTLFASLLYLPLLYAILRKRFLLSRVIAILNIATLAAFILLSIFLVQSVPYFAYFLSVLLILRNTQIIRFCR